MLSGGAAGLVSIDSLRKEQEEICEREKRNQPLEEASRNAETIFRDKSGRKRHLESERAEPSKKAGEKAEKDEKYAQWGKEKPCYKGPPLPPNRFNIMPGFRWDGVDRSSGFEQKWYSRIADKKAVQEMAYKWSVEDM